MNITETLNEGLAREYEITLTAAELDEKFQHATEVATTVKMPGFRPGKVPLGVVKARFGDQVKGEVIRTALMMRQNKRLKSRPPFASQPSMDITSL